MSSENPARTFGSSAIAITLIVTGAFYIFWPGPNEVQSTAEETVTSTAEQRQSEQRSGSSSASVDSLPKYEIVDTVDQMVGGLYGEVIIPSLPVDVDTTRMKRIAFAIMQRHGLDAAAFYRTEEARRSDLSTSFRENHPGALEEGLLGSVRNGTFTPPPYLYDPRFGGTQ